MWLEFERSKEVEGGLCGSGVVHSLGRRLAEDVISDGNLLEGPGSFGTIWEFAGMEEVRRIGYGY